MAVTTYTNQNLVLIRENGSDPTGAGGKIINDNFKKIDEALFSGTSAIVDYARYAESAYSTSYADYAGYAYSCVCGTSSGSSFGGDGYASLPGYADPWYSRAFVNDYSGKPISIWGSTSAAYIYSSVDGYSVSGPQPFACIPPFGPFSLRVNMVFYKDTDYRTAIFAELFIFGWNLDIFGIRVLHAYDVYGQEKTLDTHFSAETLDSWNASVGASIVGGMLRLSAHNGGADGTYVIHARVENTFPTSYDSGSYDGCNPGNSQSGYVSS